MRFRWVQHGRLPESLLYIVVTLVAGICWAIVYPLLGAFFAAVVQITSKKAFKAVEIDSATVNLIRAGVMSCFFAVVIGYEVWIAKARELVGTIDRPMIDLSPPNRRCQRPLDNTATRCLPWPQCRQRYSMYPIFSGLPHASIFATSPS